MCCMGYIFERVLCVVGYVFVFFFFFKQKTAYEMRISDWSSDVCSSDLLSQVVSGFNFSRSNANTPIFTLRGIGFQTPNLSATSPVGIYVDEVAYAYPYMANGPTFDLERVEVLKGPQGTLYGRNTTGGLVNFIRSEEHTSELQSLMRL